MQTKIDAATSWSGADRVARARYQEAAAGVISSIDRLPTHRIRQSPRRRPCRPDAIIPPKSRSGGDSPGG